MTHPVHPLPSRDGAPRAAIEGVQEARSQLESVNSAREAGLVACRQAIRAAGSAIRAVHRLDHERAATLIAESEASLRRAQAALDPYPMVAYAGFLHDAEKEFTESVLTRALVSGSDLPTYKELAVGAPAWLNGLAEAASELRRHLLDRLRSDDTGSAERLLEAMEEVYEAIVTVDYPDAVTGGLRRSADSLRAVLERTRSDVTTTIMQLRLRSSLEEAKAPEDRYEAR